jgi:uncharacterized membrane protein YeaQ/YmgE (transglycosylase-associated protein family)
VFAEAGRCRAFTAYGIIVLKTPWHDEESNPYTAGSNGAMNFIVWIIVGGILGWIASIIMRTNAQQGLLLNVLVGIIGALLAGVLLTPLFGVGTINQSNFSLPSLLLSLLGAVILLAVVNLVRRGTVR